MNITYIGYMVTALWVVLLYTSYQILELKVEVVKLQKLVEYSIAKGEGK